MEYYYVDAGNQAAGPVTEHQLRQLQAQGTVNAATLVAPVGETDWKPLSECLPSLAAAASARPASSRVAAAQASLANAAPDTLDTSEHDETIARGANWFFWIAALSLVNTAIILFGGNMHFVIGLGIMQIIDHIAMAVAEESGFAAAKYIALVIDLVIAAGVVAVGIFARKYFWLFLTGIILYALDGLIFLIGFDLMSVGFHALAIFFMAKGLMALRDKNEILTAHAGA